MRPFSPLSSFPGLPPRFAYLPNHGNAGDAVIGWAFEQMVIYQKCRIEEPSEKSAVPCLIGGGGNLVPMYSYLANELARLSPSMSVVMLPCSSYGRWDLLSRFADIHIYCREHETFWQAERHGIPASLTHDLAFHLDYSCYAEDEECGTLDTLYAYRHDRESTVRYIMPVGVNRDLSLEWPQQVWDIGKSETVATAFIKSINHYRRVCTDRLHVGIVATLLGKEVEFHGNIYYKNRAVFEHSLSHFPNCRWVA